MDALLEQLRIADSSGVDFLYDEYLFIWEAVLLNKWTGLSEEQEEKVVATVLGIRGSIIEGAPVVMADLFIVSHLVLLILKFTIYDRRYEADGIRSQTGLTEATELIICRWPNFFWLIPALSRGPHLGRGVARVWKCSAWMRRTFVIIWQWVTLKV